MVENKKLPVKRKMLNRTRALSISICLLAIISLIIFLYSVNSQNTSTFWTEIIAYGLSLVTPTLTFFLADIRAKDRQEISLADMVELIVNRIDNLENNSRDTSTKMSSRQYGHSSTKPGESYHSSVPLNSDRLDFLLKTGVINRRQYKYLSDKNSQQ